MKFYISRNGEKHGPFSMSEVREMMEAGKIYPMDLGWHEGLSDWTPVFKLAGISSSTAPSPAGVAATATAPPILQQKIPSSDYVESRLKGILKRGIGLLFLLIGLGVFLPLIGNQSVLGSELIYGVIMGGTFFITGGVWWLIGRGEQHLVPLSARLSLILSILFMLFANGVIEGVGRVEGVTSRGIIVAAAIVVAGLGLPAIASILLAYRSLRRSPNFKGMGRTNTALAFCFMSLCYLGGNGFILLKADEAPEKEEIAAEVETAESNEPENLADALPIMAPEGVFFLRVHKNLIFENGIIGVPPGTQVVLVETKEDMLLVRANDQEFEVNETEVTNDLREASWIIRADRHALMQLAEKGRRERVVYEERKRQEWIEHEARLKQHLITVNHPHNSRPYVSPLREGSKPVHFRWNSGSGRRASVFSEEETTKRQLNDLRRAQEAALKSQIETIKRQEQQMTTQELLRSRTISERVEMERALKQLRRNP